MSSDLSALDLATLSAAESAIVATIRSKCCQWEQDSADATAAGNLSTALLLKHWADAADLLAFIVTTEFSGFIGEVLNARFGISSVHRSPQDLVLDALALGVASAQEAPTAA